jgi:NADPH:quinone reductase-like Zn-dependent oxidoreductase
MMNALVLETAGAYPVLTQGPLPEVAEGEVIVQIEATALNHRDVWIVKGKYPGIRFPIIPGSDGAGYLGERKVVIQPGRHWGDNPKAQSKTYQITGLPSNGTFAEQVAVEARQVFDMPSHLTFEQAAALPLAGLTAYRTLFTRCQARQGEKILITGIGGGVALFCCQFALAIGMEVYVTSGDQEKLERAKKMGAAGGASYKVEGWAADLGKIAGGFDLVIDSAGGPGFEHLIKLSNPGARIGIYGGSHGSISISPQPLFWKQLSILGCTMGTDQDFAEMLQFVENHRIIPVVDSVFAMQDAETAFKRMEEGKQFGKIVMVPPKTKNVTPNE